MRLYYCPSCNVVYCLLDTQEKKCRTCFSKYYAAVDDGEHTQLTPIALEELS